MGTISLLLDHKFCIDLAPHGVGLFGFGLVLGQF